MCVFCSVMQRGTKELNDIKDHLTLEDTGINTHTHIIHVYTVYMCENNFYPRI